jgi:hypothetical protein
VSRRLLLQDSVRPGDIRALAEANDWTFVGDIDPDPENQVFYEAKWDTSEGVSIHYVVDEVVNERYVVAAGDDEARVGGVMSTVENRLDVWTLDELLNSYDITPYPAGHAQAVLRLGAGSPLSAVDSVSGRVWEAVRHQDRRVRLAAVWAMVYAAWPEYRETLAAMSERDTDPEVARNAELALRQLAENGVIEP